MWLRGGFFDSVSSLWRQVSEGRFEANDATDKDLEGRNGGSILFAHTLAPDSEITIPILVAWHFPNRSLRCGSPEENDEFLCDGNSPAWRPYYVNHWKDAREVALYVKRNYTDFRSRTKSFQEALISSTLPAEVIDAVSANLAILKSPTVLRQENGNVWGWEGCFPNAGCCPGSCTHVWNYAQSLPHLYPHLERTLREQELCRSLDERGHADFRAALPDGPSAHTQPAAADGQLGGIMKLYRDWQISGDGLWLTKLYPHARRSIDYCIATWDPDRMGALVEPHHNTYDIEFWGPDSMCGSIYIGALSAMTTMAEALGRNEEARSYRELADLGARFLDGELFNGEYFEQRVMWTNLQNRSFFESLERETMSDEERELCRREGPKYQFGSGCISDGVIGAWMARIYGVETPQNEEIIRRSLQAIVRHNFKENLTGHANPQRPGYALGDESGLLLCSWPHGGKPTLPFIYSDEVWSGIEYQVASHLIEEDMVEEGLKLVRATRSRYDGHARNPFNEYECGSYYARAMASYALLGSLSGFRYSAVTRTLWFGPRWKADPFRIFYSTAAAWGTIRLTAERLTVSVVEGELPIDRLIFTRNGKTTPIAWETTVRAGNQTSVNVSETV